MGNASSIVNTLKAEVLLGDSYILTQIAELRDSLRYKSDKEVVSFDDYFALLQADVDKLGTIQLAERVVDEAHYTNSLITFLEQIQDDCERVEVKLVSFQGRIASAAGRVKELSAAFEAWFVLAANEELDNRKLKLSTFSVRQIANGEFSRLMDHSDVALDALVEAIKVERSRVTNKKKMANKKFELGREQVNAAWSNKLPGMLGFSPAPPDATLYRPGVVEEEDLDDVVPTFVSKRTAVEPAMKQEPKVTEAAPAVVNDAVKEPALELQPAEAIQPWPHQWEPDFSEGEPAKDSATCGLCDRPFHDAVHVRTNEPVIYAPTEADFEALKVSTATVANFEEIAEMYEANLPSDIANNTFSAAAPEGVDAIAIVDDEEIEEAALLALQDEGVDVSHALAVVHYEEEAEKAAIAALEADEDPWSSPTQITDFPKNGLLCSMCRGPQYVTPHGANCASGEHGGVDGVEPTQNDEVRGQAKILQYVGGVEDHVHAVMETVEAARKGHVPSDFPTPRVVSFDTVERYGDGIVKYGTPVEATVLQVDELDAIVPATPEPQPEPAGPVAPKRKPLLFNYEDDEIV